MIKEGRVKSLQKYDMKNKSQTIKFAVCCFEQFQEELYYVERNSSLKFIHFFFLRISYMMSIFRWLVDFLFYFYN